jgi:myosin heavy subunit
MRFVTNHFVNYNIDYQFGKDRIFLKMSAQNVLENLLKKRVRFVESAATLIKVHYRRSKMSKRRS